MVVQELEPGIEIHIQRSDKRIHSAVVATINNISKYITVEWEENGQTKGKEIKFHSIFALNPHLQSKNFLMSEEKKSQSEPDVDRWLNMKNHPLSPQHQIFSQKPIYGSGVKQPWEKGKAAEEIEKIRQKREERRLKTAQKQKEAEALMKAEKGNPYWLEILMIKEYRKKLEFIPLNTSGTVKNQQITVCVRKRPLSMKDRQRKNIDIITIPQKDTVIVHEPKMKVDLTKYLDNQTFRFDYTFDEFCSNEIVYHFTAAPLIQIIFQRGRATCFAYGQTGSGKTHTMSGSFKGKNQQDLSNGIYVLTSSDVFKTMKLPEYHSLHLTVHVSYFEIYNGKVYDLLNQHTQLNVFEDGQQQVHILGLNEVVVESVIEVMKLIKNGNTQRTSGKTSANLNSSRSHAVFQIILKENNISEIYGKFSLIDLAGNERGKDANTTNRLINMEGGEINKSLLALKECIRALGQKNSHLPFRTSKLTQVLKDSFIGETSKISMIAMISPGIISCEQTLNTLYYANRVKELDINENQHKSSSIKNMENEIEKTSMEEGKNKMEEGKIIIEEGKIKMEELIYLYNLWRECCTKCDSLENELFLSNSNKNMKNNLIFFKQLDFILKSRQKQLLQLRKKIAHQIEFLQSSAEEESMSSSLENAD